MASPSEHPQLLAAIVLEGMLTVGILLVGVRMLRMGVNGPCRLCLLLLLAWRVCTVADIPRKGLDLGYFMGLLFALVFLYTVHHLAALLHELLRRRNGPPPRWRLRVPGSGSRTATS